jgi:outer membrane protein assembly factor BamA
VFPMERLRKLIPLQDGDIFNTIKIYEGLDAVENLYSSEGYADFSIMQVIALNDQDLSATVTLELDEGKQFHVGQVMGLGVDASLAESLQTALPSGDIFRPAAVDAVLKSVFPDAPANRVRLSKHTGEAKVDITVDLRPCPPVERSVQE